MNTKLKKTLNYLAAGLFVAVLLLNVKMSLDNPFSFMSEAAFAEETTGITIICSGSGQGVCYKDDPQPYEQCCDDSWERSISCQATGDTQDCCDAYVACEGVEP